MQPFDFEALKRDLNEPVEENFQKVYPIIQQFLEQKIDKDTAQANILPYAHSADGINKFFASVQPVMPFYPDQTRSNTRQKSRPWTTEEDQKLLVAIREHGNSNWAAVAQYVGNGRTKAQCSQRYNRVINPNISKANWSKEEEDKLIQIVNQVGNKAWTRVAQQFGNRSDVQCRFKYNYLMKKAMGQQQQQQPPVDQSIQFPIGDMKLN